MKKFVFVAPVAFDNLTQRHQALAKELASRGHRVWYLNPLLSNGYSLRRQAVTSHLHLVQLRVPVKGVAWPGWQSIAARIAFFLLKRTTGLKNSEATLWLGEPALAALSRYRWNAIIYDRCDLHGAFPGQNKSAWQKYEKLLFARANLICCSHSYLQKTLPNEARAKSLLAGNASADIFFANQPRALPQNRKLRVVSAGAHFEWVDLSWLRMLAGHPQLELHLAGRGRGEEYEKLRRQPGVIEHGHLNASALAELYRRCDIGLVPFKNIELILAVDPVKVYEYAASGLQVWAPPLPSLRTHPLISHFVGCHADCDDALRQTGSFCSPTSVPRWSQRMQTILDRLANLRSD